MSRMVTLVDGEGGTEDPVSNQRACSGRFPFYRPQVAVELIEGFFD